MISLLNYANLHSLAQIFYLHNRTMDAFRWFLPAINDYDQPASDRIAPAAATTKHSAYWKPTKTEHVSKFTFMIRS